MKVRELIAALSRLDPEADVHIAYNYGDHWRTQVAPAIRRVGEADVRHSAYHSMPALVDDDDDEGEPRDGDRCVVVMSA
jgi:hypothetical protein